MQSGDQTALLKECQHTFVVWRNGTAAFGRLLKTHLFSEYSVYSALGVSAIKRYINQRFTYLLTYLLFAVYW